MARLSITNEHEVTVTMPDGSERTATITTHADQAPHDTPGEIKLTITTDARSKNDMKAITDEMATMIEGGDHD
jgi:hypothetical protein